MFTPVETTLGALLLHQASSSLLFHNGQVFGCSSLLRTSFTNPTLANVPTLAGLAGSALIVKWVAPAFVPAYPEIPVTGGSLLWTGMIGFLIGWGTKNGQGCTSGHMLCGLSRLSTRSILATTVFFLSALVTANIFNSNIPTCASGPCYVPTWPSIPAVLFMIATNILSLIVNTNLPFNLPPIATSRSVMGFFSGLEFGLGLLVSGMADPAKVLRFFSITNIDNWDPSLALVMIFGVVPNYIVTRLRGFDNPPTLEKKFLLPTKTWRDIDWRFVVGSAVFGIGWGLSGVCPGPGIIRSILQPLWGTLWLPAYVIAGMLPM